MNRGVLLAISAYGMWGFFPVYWKLLKQIPALQLLGHRIGWSFILLVVVLVGLQVWLARSPLIVMGGSTPSGEIFDLQTAVGRVFADVQECGEQQKDLYQCIAAYKEKHGRLPKDKNELINSIHDTRAFDDCPAGRTWYVIHFENFGNCFGRVSWASLP